MNEIESNRQFITYRGFLDSLEVTKVCFDLSEKNKSRKFYTRMKDVLKDLVQALNQYYPNMDAEIRCFNS